MALQQATSFASFRNQIFYPSKTIHSAKLGVSSSPLFITKIKLSSSSLTRKSVIKAQQISHEEDRPQVSFPPTIWGDSFRSFSFKQSEYESYNEQIEVLKPEVKSKLISGADDAFTKLIFINLLIRLGLSYHFEDEIEQQLDEHFDALVAHVSDEECDLHTVSLVFRVLRQNGYKITSDVFNKFKDSDGKFKQSLATDIGGVLSLYEAAFVSITGEDILDEAIAFTKPVLESYSNTNVNVFEKHIRNALKHPFHRGMPRVEARQFISLYEMDESRDEILLNFAKLDFNRVQLVHQQELSDLSRWWSDLDLVSKYPFARDRIVELYFWMMGVFFEPQYGGSRVLVTQILILLSVVDDIYDGYGTLDELKCFTQGIERWGTSSLDLLPEYMKVLYKAFIDLLDQFENDMKQEERAFTVPYVKNEVIQIIKAYMSESQWYHDGYVPSLDEYMEAASCTGGIPIIIAGCYARMAQVKGTKEFEWLIKNPKIMKASGAISRLMDDLVTHKDEQERGSGHVASSIECYMNHHGVSEEKATEEIKGMVEALWKEMNEECLRPTALPLSLLMPIVNIIRVVEVCYRYCDGYTNPEYVKEYIKSMFVQPIPIQQ
ncbi:probable terpene synthase 6 [Mercurialis annua]|uniref:probable terpene synthase 6 n=1 Tax=Mercurialis annua TaxID=3986 RepID=UPI00215F34EC|nr:probable terpene synthase 6 [Mercurialis annua]